MAIHQLIPSFVPGDATGQAAVHLQFLLRRLGHFGHIHAGEVAPSLSALARPSNALRPAPDDLVLYHHGIASPLSGRLLHLPCRKGLVFHNVTPAHFYRGTPLEEALLGGRAQLAALAPHMDVCIGVSRFNAEELRAAGARDPRVVPLFVEPERFTQDASDPQRLRAWRQGGPAVVSVSRVAPHKRFEDLLSLHEELLRLRPDARLLLVGGYEAGGRYFRTLQRRARALRGVQFLGKVDHAGLVAAYRAGAAFVSMSEHEGFGVPLVEAMAADLPVLAYAAAAVPETLGGAGVAFTEKRFAFLAELVHALWRDDKLRAKVLRGQRRRLSAFSPAAAQAALQEALGQRAPARPARRGRAAKKRPLGIVVQRYGEVTGGAEKHAQMVAERLADEWDVEVLTTCARDHLDWADHFPEGESKVGPVRVRRFGVERPREMRAFNALSRRRFALPQDRVHEEHWVAEQGPLCPGLLRHLSEQGGAYAAFVFFTYLYAPTVWGLPLVAGRSVLVPTAHDEPPFAFHAYAEPFERARALLCNTVEEEALIRRRFPRAARSRIVGVGVEPLPGQPERFRAAHDVRHPYLLYVGRIEPGKGVGEMLQAYRALRRARPDAPDLVLAGSLSMKLSGEGVRHVGRISDQAKWDALAGAEAVVAPSRYESLSLLALEAFAAGAPLLANGASEVLAGQVQRSGAGACYGDAASFVSAADRVLRQRGALGKKGRAYARRHRWPEVMAIYREELSRIVDEETRA
jgi:glycosyltransferase involved in cell wall biosynthesis